jgi:predicted dehydrogenase
MSEFAKPLRIAIIGLGKQGTEHLNACLRMPNEFKIVAVCDNRKHTLHAYDALSRPIPTFDSLEAMTKSKVAKPQAVVIATPPTEYMKLVRESIKHNYSILLEKPLGCCYSQATSILRLAANRDVAMCLAAQRRYHCSFKRLVEIFRQDKDIRQVNIDLSVAVQANGQSEATKVSALKNWRLRVGTTLDLGFHAIDLARELCGELKLISATVFDNENRLCRNRREDVESHMLFVTETGTMVRIKVSRSNRKREKIIAQGDRIRIVCTRDRIACSRVDRLRVEERFASDWDNAMQLQLSDFRDIVLERKFSESRDRALASLATMRLIEQVYLNPDYV